MISKSLSTCELRRLAAFLADYGARLMGCGATCIRIEKNLRRIASTYGAEVEAVIMPRHVRLCVTSRSDASDCVTIMVPVKGDGIDFELNTRLSRLSWKIADRHLPLARAEGIFRALTRPRHRRQSRASMEFELTLLVTLANASFCRLFGGDGVAMAVVAAATMAGFGLKISLQRAGVDIRAIFMVCAFVSAVLGSTGLLFAVGTSTPQVALATSVLYLVPGIPFINSFSDMLYRHYVCAFSRLVDALVLTCCLSIGLCAGMLAMHAGMF